MVHPAGVEPATFWSVARGATIDKHYNTNALSSSPSSACTTACTRMPESLQESPLEALAAALRSLTPEEGVALAALLKNKTAED